MKGARLTMRKNFAGRRHVSHDIPADELVPEALRRMLRCLDRLTLGSAAAPSFETVAVMDLARLALAQREGRAVDPLALAEAIADSSCYGAGGA
jgi:hypothetical protein